MKAHATNIEGKNDPLYYETILENIIMGDLPSKSSHSIRCLN